MQEQHTNTPDHQNTSPETVAIHGAQQPQYPQQNRHQQVMQPQPIQQTSPIKMVERVTVWVMALSAIFFALISIMSIWGVLGEDTKVVSRSLASLAVIAFTALVINIAANILDPAKKK